MNDRRARVAEIYARYAASVYRRARSLLGDDGDAREVLHDLFVSLLERPEQFSGASAQSTFLYSATTHACLNRLRNQRNRARLLREHTQPTLPIAATTGPELIVCVRHALRRLPSPLAEVAVYYFVDGLSQREIAELLGCSQTHVGHLLERLERWGRAQEAPCSAT